MVLNVNDRTVFWGAVSSNYFWGKRSGMTFKDTNFPGGNHNAFKIKKWRNGSNNSGPSGKKAHRSGKYK